MKQTTIQISEETWKRLLNRKAYPSQTFNAIINNLMDYEKANVSYKLNKREVKKNDNTKDC